jgi:hypothetical protein
MSHPPTALRPDVQQLVDEKYEVAVYLDHLLVESIPYVTPTREVAYGVLVCPYAATGKPDHTVYFRGDTPCNRLGQPLTQLINNSNPVVIFDRFQVNHYFSNKPSNDRNFPADYYAKLKHYIDILGAQARMIDPDADARTGRVKASGNVDSVFRYGDSASARAGLVAVAQKLWLPRIAIIGLGGTGSYILDQVAKTPVKEIHLFDGDVYKRHNAFRSPGAASLEQLQSEPTKVGYFHAMYDPMRTGIIPHSYHLNGENINELAGFDFVFVAVDDGPSRGLICRFLRSAGVPFIDVGMGLSKVESSMSVRGNCRVTLCTPVKHDHIEACVDMHDDRVEALYTSNIQVADMNAMNAVLAVIRWKQYFGFYSDSEMAHNLGFSIDLQSVSRKEKTPRPDA